MKIYSIPLTNIANFDETNVNYDMPSKRCLSRQGMRTISIKTLSSSQQCTTMLGVTADGKKLPPFLIFKAKPNGLVQRKELVELVGYPTGQHHTVQSNAWMDKERMLQWLDQVWCPFANHPDQNGMCMLMLDEFKGHMVG
mmetsp:Transcript_1634/g.2340  ORF Transcript_1634/g.2340 Transcript_1634/m.2340 type:complete len:140 (+) Transcript_1634:42-461(+)